MAAGGYDPIETASRDEIRALQVKRARWSLAHAYAGNPRYRVKLHDAGIFPEDLIALEDLARFPFTTKQDLLKAGSFGFFAVSADRITRFHLSSGRTSEPVLIGYTRRDLENWGHLMARSIHAAGGRRGMRVQISYGYGLACGGLGAHYGAEMLGCSVIPVSAASAERQVELIRDLRPQMIMTTPGDMMDILGEFTRQAADPHLSSLRIGMLGLEPWAAKTRHSVENSFAMDALDSYGLSEVAGPGVAQECIETKDGLTIWEDHFYPEIIDPETGQVLPEGREGELVLTTLTKEAMPLIRYRTGDITCLLPGTARSMRRLGKISGR
jgi:phenylacetate-CoA ligase